MLKTKIAVSPLFFTVLSLVLILDKTGISGIALLFSVLHEIGHILALLCLKIRPEAVFITPFGIQIRLSGNLSTVKKCAVFVAGFAVNFLLSAFFFLFGNKLFGYVNLIIGIFTLFPIASTDGGSFLIALFEEIFPQKADRIFKIISEVFMVLLMIILLLIFILTKNYFILLAVFYMIFCTIKNAAR